MPLSLFGDPVGESTPKATSAFGDPIDVPASKIQKLNHTELAALPQFQQEQPSMLDRMAGSISDVVSPMARIPQTIGDVAATIMNSPFYAARALGLIDRTKPQIRITPEGISQEQVPVMPPFVGQRPIAQIPFQPSVMQPNAPDALALANKALGMITPEVAVGAAAGVPGSAMAGYFAPQVAAQIPQEVQNTVNQWGDPVMTTREKVGATGNTLADIGMAFLLTHGMMPPEVGKSGLTRADINDPRVFNMPNKPGIPIPDVEAPKEFGTPIIGQRLLDVGQRMVTANEPQVGGPITPAYQSVGEPKQGGQISFEGQNGIPNAIQQAQPSMAQMLEEAIKRNQIEREQNARSLRTNEESLPYDQGKERQSALQQEASGAIRSGDLQQEPETGSSGYGSELRTKGQQSGTVNDLTRSSEGGNEPKDMALASASNSPTTSEFPTKVGEELGLTFNPKEQASGVSLEGLPPEIASKILKTWEFTDRQPGSKTEGMTFYVPENSTRKVIEEAFRTKQNSWEPKLQVPLSEKLKLRLQEFNRAQQKRIASGESMGRLDAGLFDDIVNVGKFAYGVSKDFTQWSLEMTKRLGEHIKPHLYDVWSKIQSLPEEMRSKVSESPSYKYVSDKLTPTSIGTGIKSAIDKNQEAGSVSLDQFKEFGEATWKAAKGLAVDFQVMKDAFKRNANFSDIIAKHGSIANGALTTATRAENHVNLEATRIFGDDSKKALNAVVAVLEAKGDKSKLAQFALQSSKDKKASEAVAFAQANWNKIQLLMKAVEGVDKFNRATAKANGIDVPYLSDYLKRMYEKEQGTFTRSRQPSGTGYSSRLKRQYETIFDAIEDGQKPVTLNAAALVGKRTNEIFNEVNQHLWTEHLKNINDSVTKEPIAQEMKVKAKGVRIAPEGHVSVDLPNGHTIAVLDGYDRLIKAVTGESHVNNSLAGRMLLQTVGGIKHGTLAFDVFHLARVAMFRKSLGLKGGYERGLAVLEFSNNDLDQAVKQGLIPQEAADYSREKVAIGGKSLSRREIVSLGIQNGLGVGKHSEALYTSFARSIPGLGNINRFIFDKFTRGAITEAFVNEAVRVSKDHPTLSLGEVAQKVSRDINFRMGNIGKQGIFKSATMQDLLRIPFLAPQWVESMGQSEARSVGQVVKAVNPMSEDFGKVGTLAKSTARIVATFVAATQVVNMISTGHPTWQNDKGHQMDAFVPPLTKNGKGFWISPLSVAAELTHDFLRLTRKNNDPLESAGKIVSNKLSPLGHGEEMLRTGMDWKGEKHHGWDRVVSAIQESFNPTPLPVKQAIESAKAKDLAPFERQGFATIGVKAEPESYDEQKQRVINDMRKGGSMSLQDRKELEESLKSLRPTPTDSAKIASATRSMEQMFERKNAIRDELPKDMQVWMKNKGLDIESFGPSITYRKTRIGLTSQEAEEYKGIVRDAYIQFLEPWVGQDVTQARLNGVMERAKNYARKELKAKMQE